MVNTTNSTAKKRVPDWLNSSLWSSSPLPPPPPPTPHQPSKNEVSTSKSSIGRAEVEEPRVEAPVPVPPPVISRAEKPRVEIRDPLSSTGASNYVIYGSDDEVDVEENVNNSSNRVAAEATTTTDTTTPRPTVRTANPAAEDISRQAHLLQEVSMYSL